MSTAVGVRKEGKVALAADSLWVYGESIRFRGQSLNKFVVLDDSTPSKAILSLTGRGRWLELLNSKWGQLLASRRKELLSYPHAALDQICDWMSEVGGLDDEGMFTDSSILVAWGSELYLSNGRHWLAPVSDFWAIGSGSELALGALIAMSEMDDPPDANGMAERAVLFASEIDAYTDDNIKVFVTQGDES